MNPQHKPISLLVLLAIVVARIHDGSAFSQRSSSSRLPTTVLGAAIQEPPTVTETDVLRRSSRHHWDENDENEWEVRIYNDDTNTREKVARVLVLVTGTSEMEAYRTMMKAHQSGVAIVGETAIPLEIAEVYREGFLNHGLLSDIVPVLS